MLPDWRTMPSDERDAMLAKLCDVGLSASEIAARFTNCSRNSVIGRIIRMNNPKVKLQKPSGYKGNVKHFAKKFAPWTPGEVRIVENMLREGARSIDIAARFGMSDMTLRNRVNEHPVLSKIGFVTRGQILRRAAAKPPKKQDAPKPERKAAAFAVSVEISDPARRPEPQKLVVVQDACPADAIPLVDLTLWSCRWPVYGEGADTMFCGHQSLPVGAYCARHQARSAGRVFCEAA